MPGQPIFAALEQRLNQAGDEPFQLIADGRSMREVAAHFGTSRTQLYRWISGHEGRKAALARARRFAAVSHVDDALAGLDAATTPAEAQIARERATMRRWMAERWDRETFGVQTEAPTVNINQLHLALLKDFAGRLPARGGDELRSLPAGGGREEAASGQGA